MTAPTIKGRPFILLVEGVDRVGKTTAVETLKSQLMHPSRTQQFPDVRVVHFGAPDGNPFEEYREALALADRAASEGVPTIFDRMHWSNQAYDPVYRGPGSDTILSQEEYRILENRGLDLGLTVVLYVRPVEDIVADIAAHDEELAHLSENGDLASDALADLEGTTRRLQQTFDACYVNSALRKYRLNFGDPLSRVLPGAEQERGVAQRHQMKRRGY